MLFRIGEIARQEVRLADVLVRATMAWIELDGALVVRERQVVLLQVAVGIAEGILQVRVVGIAYLGALQEQHGLRPILLLDRPFARCIVLIPLGEIRVHLVRIGGGDRGEDHGRRAQQTCGDKSREPAHCEASFFALSSSGRAVSASFASVRSFR